MYCSQPESPLVYSTGTENIQHLLYLSVAFPFISFCSSIALFCIGSSYCFDHEKVFVGHISTRLFANFSGIAKCIQVVTYLESNNGFSNFRTNAADCWLAPPITAPICKLVASNTDVFNSIMRDIFIKRNSFTVSKTISICCPFSYYRMAVLLNR